MPDFPYVLKIGGKNPSLVKILHIWFDWLGFAPPPPYKNWEALGGTFTEHTKQTVIKYQQWRGITPANGEVRAAMWGEMGKQIGYKVFDRKLYDCFYKNNCNYDPKDYSFLNRIGYSGNTLSGGIWIYGPYFMKMYFQEFAQVSKDAFSGLAQFFDFMRNDANLTDVRRVAYMMATVYKETGGAWQPIDEKGGASKWYGKPVTVTCDGKKYTNSYYGRGYVQLTRTSDDKNNPNGGLYYEVSQKLGIGCELVANPERAKEPALAYKILSNGMKDGWYIRNETLSKYIDGNLCDYYNARNIVNTAHDAATEIQGYAKTFEGMLRASMVR